MGVMIGISVVIATIVGTAVSQLLAEELTAWAAWCAEKLLERSVDKLPKEFRERFAEEWRSHLRETPGRLSKLFVALSFSSASRRIGLISTKLSEPAQTSVEPTNAQLKCGLPISAPPAVEIMVQDGTAPVSEKSDEESLRKWWEAQEEKKWRDAIEIRMNYK